MEFCIFPAGGTNGSCLEEGWGGDPYFRVPVYRTGLWTGATDQSK
ncbi:hypothetical protein OS190_07375 [Sulfitobacter sp. F26204]|nr:hypothetical protein [Sulfitobacter sp. F26204]MCX7559388.1 hypothetical protein [Sulfitobacter sp. F26204]